MFVAGEARAVRLLEEENTFASLVEESWFLCAATSPHPISASFGGLACPDVG